MDNTTKLYPLVGSMTIKGVNTAISSDAVIKDLKQRKGKVFAEVVSHFEARFSRDYVMNLSSRHQSMLFSRYKQLLSATRLFEAEIGEQSPSTPTMFDVLNADSVGSDYTEVIRRHARSTIMVE